MEVNETITWQDFLNHLRLLEEEGWRANSGDEWMIYVHPSIAKHHPKVKYLRRYDRRGERMRRRRMGKKR